MSENSAQSPASNLDRVEELTWAMLDDQISEHEFEQLNRTLLSDNKSRDSYLQCVQLHADLMAHFAETPCVAKRATGTTILGMLNADNPSLGLQSPAAGEAI
jgi:hypothetical protein